MKTAKPTNPPAPVTHREVITQLKNELREAQDIYVKQTLKGYVTELPTLRELRYLVNTASKHVDRTPDGITVYGSPLHPQY
jgi:hypothetical protein